MPNISGRLVACAVAEFTGFDGDGNPTYRDVDGNGIGDPDVDMTVRIPEGANASSAVNVTVVCPVLPDKPIFWPRTT